MEIENLVIEKCIELFEQERKAREDYPAFDSKADWGEPPRAMVIMFGKGLLIKESAYFRELTEIEKAWYYANGTLEETDLKREWVQMPISGMYYAEAFSEFMIEEETQRVWLNYYFGPRYARGVSFSVEQQNGSMRIYDEKSHWVS